MTDKLGNSFSDSAKDNLEVSINSGSDFLHKEVSTGLTLLRRWASLFLFRFRDWLALVVVSYRFFLLLIFLWHNRGTVEFVVVIIGEYVVLLRVNDCFDNISCVITLRLQD